MRKTGKLWKIACLLMATVLSLSACKDPADSSSSEEEKDNAPEKLAVATDAKTGGELFLTKDSVSEYKIVLPENASEAEEYAADYLYDIVRQATGTKLRVVSDSSVSSFTENDYVISLGETALFEQNCEAKTQLSSVDTNGFVMSLEANTVYICGPNGMGTLNGVQEFLSYVLDYELYALDEVFFNEATTVKMIDFGAKIVSPSVKYSVPGARHSYEVEDASLLKSVSWMKGYADLDGQKWHTKTLSHSIEKIAPMSDYPTWYPNNQICFSVEAAQDLMAETIAGYIEESPESVVYYMLGNRDNANSCNCDNCIKSSQENGGVGGAYVVWLNEIASKIEKILEPKGLSEREWYLMGLAYLAYEGAPVVYNDSTKKYEPVNDNVVCDKHVGMQFAPIWACYYHAMNDPDCQYNVQANTMRNFEGWSVCTEEYFLWIYYAEYRNYYFIHDGFGSIKGNAELFDKYGVDGVFWQRTDNPGESFGALRTYLMYKLSWDSSLSYDKLVNDFFTNYYKEAAPYMREYFDLIRANMHQIGTELDNGGCHVAELAAGNYFQARFWPYQLLQSYEQVIEKAYQAIKDANYDDEMAEKMRLRIRADELFCTAYFITSYASYFSDSEYKELYEAYLRDAKLVGNLQGVDKEWF